MYQHGWGTTFFYRYNTLPRAVFTGVLPYPEIGMVSTHHLLVGVATWGDIKGCKTAQHEIAKGTFPSSQHSSGYIYIIHYCLYTFPDIVLLLFSVVQLVSGNIYGTTLRASITPSNPILTQSGYANVLKSSNNITQWVLARLLAPKTNASLHIITLVAAVLVILNNNKTTKQQACFHS